MEKESIYRVSFTNAPIEGDTRKDFYFFSVSAIYDVFTPAQIGCKVSRLWNIGVPKGNPYNGRLCNITKEPILRKKRNKAL